MLGQIINIAFIITLLSIALPFIFALWVLRIIFGGRRERRHWQDSYAYNEYESSSTTEEFSRRLRNLKRRIENLEILNKRRKKEW